MARRKKGDPVHGWLVLDKPVGITSAQAVAKAKRMLNARKVGHSGTLDPLASGVLPLAFGEATKVVSNAMDGEKTYHFTVRWGEARTTDDCEGDVTGTSAIRPTGDAIQAALPAFTGKIQQKPPAFSAIKVKGERAYDLARRDEAPDLPPRKVEIFNLHLVSADHDTATFDVDCGKGTYVRSLARDLAKALGTVGHVTALRRTRAGPFGEAQAIILDKIEDDQKVDNKVVDKCGDFGHSPALRGLLLPLETPLDDIPAVAVMDGEANRLRNGQPVFVPRQIEGDVLIKTSGNPVGLGVLEGGTLKPKRLFVFD